MIELDVLGDRVFCGTMMRSTNFFLMAPKTGPAKDIKNDPQDVPSSGIEKKETADETGALHDFQETLEQEVEANFSRIIQKMKTYEGIQKMAQALERHIKVAEEAGRGDEQEAKILRARLSICQRRIQQVETGDVVMQKSLFSKETFVPIKARKEEVKPPEPEPPKPTKVVEEPQPEPKTEPKVEEKKEDSKLEELPEDIQSSYRRIQTLKKLAAKHKHQKEMAEERLTKEEAVLRKAVNEEMKKLHDQNIILLKKLGKWTEPKEYKPSKKQKRSRASSAPIEPPTIEDLMENLRSMTEKNQGLQKEVVEQAAQKKSDQEQKQQSEAMQQYAPQDSEETKAAGTINVAELNEGNFLARPEKVYRVRGGEYKHPFSPVEERIREEKSQNPDMPSEAIQNYFDNISNRVAEDIMQAGGSKNIDQALSQMKRTEKGRRDIVRFIGKAFRDQNCLYTPGEKLTRAFTHSNDNPSQTFLDCNLLAEGFMHVGRNLGLPIEMAMSNSHAYSIWQGKTDQFEIEATEFRAVNETVENGKNIRINTGQEGENLINPMGWRKRYNDRNVLKPYGKEVARIALHYKPLSSAEVKDVTWYTLNNTLLQDKMKSEGLREAQNSLQSMMSRIQNSPSPVVIRGGVNMTEVLASRYIGKENYEAARSLKPQRTQLINKFDKYFTAEEQSGDPIEDMIRNKEVSKRAAELARQGMEGKLEAIMLPLLEANDVSDENKNRLKNQKSEFLEKHQVVLTGTEEEKEEAFDYFTKKAKDSSLQSFRAMLNVVLKNLSRDPKLKKQIQTKLRESQRKLLKVVDEFHDKNNTSEVHENIRKDVRDMKNVIEGRTNGIAIQAHHWQNKNLRIKFIRLNMVYNELESKK